MRVAYVHWAFTDVDPIGEGIITYEFAQALSRFIDIEVYYQRGRIFQLDAPRVKMHRFRWYERKYSLPFNLYTLTKVIFSKPIHIIHQFQYTKNLLTLSTFLDISYIVSGFLPYKFYKKIHGIDKNILGTNLEKVESKKLGIIDGILARLEYRLNKYILSDEFFLSRVDYFIAHHNDMMKWLIMNGCNKDKVTVIYPPVNTDKFKPAESEPKNNRVLFVGRLDRHKGFHLLCDILPELVKEVPDLEVTICGDGPLRSHLFDNILKKRPDLRRYVRHLGMVDRAFLPTIYKEARLVCNPTYYESFGMVNLEAMSCGVPVVSTRTGAIPEIVKEDCGILVEPGDRFALKEAIIKVLLDERLWWKLSNNCRRHVLNNFSYEVVAPKILKIYDKVCRV